jgi:hypothetical protein
MNGFSDDEMLNLRSGQSATTKLYALVKLAKEVTENKGRVAVDTLTAFYEAGYTTVIWSMSCYRKALKSR